MATTKSLDKIDTIGYNWHMKISRNYARVNGKKSNSGLLFLLGIVIGLVGIFGLKQGVLFVTTQIAQTQRASATQLAQVFGANTNAVNSIQLSTNRTWFLLEDPQSADTRLELSVTLVDNQARELTDTTQTITYQIVDTQYNGTFVPAEGRYTASFGPSVLAPGTYEVVAILDSENPITSNTQTFNVSYPIYVTWTLDWEGYNVSDQYLSDLVEISQKHNNLPLTHFFNPRLYTNREISADRQAFLTNWVINRRDQAGDAIGLHLHMFPDMVEAAGVHPHENPIKWGNPRDDGYDILTSDYSYDETLTMLNWSKRVFEQKGLGTPKMFRAGGWFADIDTLRAVQAAGFDLDSSGRTAYSFGKNNVQGYWTLADTTQPYRPNITDQNSAAAPQFDLWEFPNNGGDSWAYTTEQMIERFDRNYSSPVLEQKRLVTYLSHPEWFHVDKPKVDAVFSHTDQFLYTQDRGPVVYITLQDAYTIWSN